MNLYKNHTVYKFVLYNLYNSCMDSFVWIRTKTTLCTNSYNLYTICIQFVYNLYSMKNCIQVGISTGDQYHACNRRCVCHPPPHLFHQWPFYLYTGQESDTYELRKPSKKRDCTNSFVCHIVNPNLQKITVEQFPLDGVFCVCVCVFLVVLLAAWATQMCKCANAKKTVPT